MRTIAEKAYYSGDYVGDGHLRFPRSNKSYLEIGCSEWEKSSMEEKVLDLGYMITHGFDLRGYIANYSAERPQNKSYILSAIVSLIGYLRNSEDLYDFGMTILQLEGRITIQEAAELLCKEIVPRYEERISYFVASTEPQVNQSLKSMPLWNYEALGKLHLSKEEYYAVFKLSTKEYINKYNFNSQN